MCSVGSIDLKTQEINTAVFYPKIHNQFCCLASFSNVCEYKSLIVNNVCVKGH